MYMNMVVGVMVVVVVGAAVVVVFKKNYRARILIKSARFPAVGFDIEEISSSSNEDMSLFSKSLIVPGF